MYYTIIINIQGVDTCKKVAINEYSLSLLYIEETNPLYPQWIIMDKLICVIF